MCEALQALHGVGIGPAKRSASEGAGLEEDRGLACDDIVVGLLAEGTAVGDVELQQLTVGEHLAKVRHAIDDVEVAGEGHLREGHGGDEVAHEDGSLVVEERIDGALSAAHHALIHDIVVHEAGGVEHLHTCGSM